MVIIIITTKSQNYLAMEDNIKIGWREWVQLPDLGLKRIKAKIDTGARTSSLDSRVLDFVSENGIEMVLFEVTYGGPKSPKIKQCKAPVVEHRTVTDSGGHSEDRPVIKTTLRIGETEKEIEVTLTPRNNMKFRMLLGRTAINDNFAVYPSSSYLTGSKKKLSSLD